MFSRESDPRNHDEKEVNKNTLRREKKATKMS
jgi:hypothetical protein